MTATDLDTVFRSSRVQSRIEGSLLGINLAGFACALHRRGYALHTIQVYTQAAEHFSSWLAEENVRPARIADGHVNLFLSEHLPKCACPIPAPRTRRNVRPAVKLLMNFLRERGVAAGGDDGSPVENSDLVVSEFDRYLADICGLSDATRVYRRRYLREFLEWKFRGRAVKPCRISTGDIRSFLMVKLTRCTPGSAGVIAGSLRSYFRFLLLKGDCGAHLLAQAVPSIQRRPSGHIPRVLSSKELGALLRSFDRKTPAGRRDYAMALCMVELGLRASEVAGLSLEDICWREGVVTLTESKSHRQRALPVPVRVGKAISSYLKKGRPPSRSRNVFVRHRVPHGGPLTPELVRGAMRRAYARAGFDTKLTGTHPLRRTAATRMLGRGATMKEIADVLGHRSLDTTKVYTKVNLSQLRSVALPWPGRTGSKP